MSLHSATPATKTMTSVTVTSTPARSLDPMTVAAPHAFTSFLLMTGSTR